MSCGIYSLINIETLEEYIGKSINIEVRWSEHKNSAIKGINTKLYRAIRKYGWEKFDKHIIEECLEAELNDKEISKLGIPYYNTTLSSPNSNPVRNIIIN